MLIQELDFLIRVLIADGQEKTKSFKEIMNLRLEMASNRYLNASTPIPKNKAMNLMLWHYPEREFRQIVRMDKKSFVKLVEQIKYHRVFQSNSMNKQEAVWIQLMVTLQRLGCDGN
jgi:hypothetical protein